MYCTNCGRELPEGTKFCKYCGTPQEAPPTPSTPPMPAPVKKKSSGPKIALAAVALIAVIAAAVILTPFALKKVNEKRYEMKLASAQRYMDSMDYEQAVIAYKAAIQIDPKNLDTYLELSEAYLAQDDTSAAATILERAVTIVTSGYENREDIIGDSGAVISRLADLYIEEGRYSEAHELYDTGKEYLPERKWEKGEKKLAESEKSVFISYLMDTLIPEYGMADFNEGKVYYSQYSDTQWDLSPYSGLVSVIIDDLDGDSALEMVTVTCRPVTAVSEYDSSYSYTDTYFDLTLYRQTDGQVSEKQRLEGVGVLESGCTGYITVFNYEYNSNHYLCAASNGDTMQEYGYKEIRVFAMENGSYKMQAGFRYNGSEGDELTELQNAGDPVVLRYITHWSTVDSDGRDVGTGSSGNSGVYDSLTEALAYTDTTLDQFNAKLYWNMYADDVFASLKSDTPPVSAFTVRAADEDLLSFYRLRVYDNSELHTIITESRISRIQNTKALPLAVNSKTITDHITTGSGADVCFTDIAYPEFMPQKGLNGVDSINQLFADMYQRARDEIVIDAQQAAAEYEMTYPYEYTASFTVPYNTGYVLGVSTNNYDYYGGAHGYGYLAYYNFDVITGQKLSLTDISNEVDGFQTFLRQDILRQAMESGDSEGMFAGYDTTIMEYDLNTNWLLDESGFTFIFNAYDLGSYAAGAFQYTVPYSRCTYYLNEYGKLILGL